ncbi:signal recognition particle 14kD protein [Sarocladium strictum]
MSQPYLEVDDFFNGLGELLKKQQERGKGSIYLTQKRGPTTPSSVIPSKPLPEGTDLILIRASDSKNGRSKSNTTRTKLTTFVAPSELDKFYERYATMCKAGMLGLKPRDKSKKKSQQKKKKKRAAATAEE